LVGLSWSMVAAGIGVVENLTTPTQIRVLWCIYIPPSETLICAPFIFTLGLALALPFATAEANAASHERNQLRSTVLNGVPVQMRNLPYHGLDCAGISEIHLINVQYSNNSGEHIRRINAVLRRYGLIR